MRRSSSLIAFLSVMFAVCTAPAFAAYNAADADYDRAEAYARRAMDDPYSYYSSPATYADRNAFWAPNYWGDSDQQQMGSNYQSGFNSNSPVIYPNTTANPPKLSNGTGANSASPFGIAAEMGADNYRNSPSTAPFYGGLGYYGGLGLGNAGSRSPMSTTSNFNNSSNFVNTGYHAATSSYGSGSSHSCGHGHH
jgi:hypothetical protein